MAYGQLTCNTETSSAFGSCDRSWFNIHKAAISVELAWEWC